MCTAGRSSCLETGKTLVYPCLEGLTHTDVKPPQKPHSPNRRLLTGCTFFLHLGLEYWDLTLPIKRASCPFHLPVVSLGTPLAEINPSLLVRDDKKNENVWTSLGCIMVNGVPWKVPWPKNLGPYGPFGSWPWDFPRDFIHPDTPLAFPHIVPTSNMFRTHLIYF